MVSNRFPAPSTMRLSRTTLILMLLLSAAMGKSQGLKVLFDNTKVETAGNADWIIDTHQPVPSPAQAGITPSSPENYWIGAISAWGVDLVKNGFTVHTLTASNGISYGNPLNSYDLSNYKVFIVCEPQGPFSAAEKAAITTFVQNGGGLFMVSDHDGSDRNSDGWDSPKVWNDLRSDSLFGIHFQSSLESNNNISEVATNVAPPSDPIIVGPAGTVTTLSYHNGTTMNLLTGVNPAATGHVWMNAASQGTTQVMAATSRYGLGKVAGVGDSSPADDGTGQSGNSLFTGWNEAGATDNILFLNLTLWLAAAETTYTINASAGSGGSIVPSGAVSVSSGADRIFTITPDAGHHVDSLVVDGAPQPPATTYTFTGVAGNHTIRAAFAIDTFTISATAGPHGIIAPSGVFSADFGSNVDFTATPDPMYAVDTIRVDGVPLDTMETSFTLSGVASDHFVSVTFRYVGLTIDVPVRSHWNLISVPLDVNNFSETSLFPSARSKAFAYDQAYQVQDTLKAGRGYWVEFDHDQHVTENGAPRYEDSISVQEGWNLIGSISVPVPVPSIVGIPPGLAVSRFFGYSGGYVAADTILPGFGYWVKAAQSGVLLLSSSPPPAASVR